MKSIIKKLINKETVTYLVFGVLTTVVALGTFFGVLWIGTFFFHDEMGNPTNGLRLFANILKWIFAVLVSFYTNKKWVFFDETKVTKHCELFNF